MSTLGLIPPPTYFMLTPKRLEKRVPDLFKQIVGRQGLNIYRVIDGHHTIPDLARLFHRSEKEIFQILRHFQKGGYVEYTIAEEMSFEQKLEAIPTLIISQDYLGLH